LSLPHPRNFINGPPARCNGGRAWIATSNALTKR
jgi:hypothetical protein